MGTLHPDQPQGMGLRQALPILSRANPGHRDLDQDLQSQQTPLRHRRPHTMAACEQPSWKRQL